jgi:tRNA(Ile)-lysidine synthase
VSKSASAADDAPPISAAEAKSLFRAVENVPVLILAVSGGPDSTALMVLAAQWREACAHPPKLIAVTVDHGLRPESKREAKAVERLARKLGLAHRTLRWTGRKPRTGLQQAARLARYRLLAGAARKAGARHVVTAHTLDDQAETVFIRLARGSGIGGLAGMAEVAGVPGDDAIRLVRPLLAVPKARLIATLKGAGIPYADDPSNRDPRFTRARIRALMPALAREGLTAARLATLAGRVQRVEDALARAVDDAQSRLAPAPWPKGGPVTMDARAFADLPREIALRLIGRAIAWAGYEGPVELGKLEALHVAMADPLAAATSQPDRHARFRRTLAGAVVTLAGGCITIGPAPPRRGGGATLTTRQRGRRKSVKPR